MTLSADQIIGKKTLLIGESGSGKTTLMGILLLKMIQEWNIPPNQISVLDFAPPRSPIGTGWLGGTVDGLFDPNSLHPRFHEIDQIMFSGVRWLRKMTGNGDADSPPFRTPRLSARNAQEIYDACLENYRLALRQLQILVAQPTPIVMVNDITIFLHLGGLREIEKIFHQAPTAVLNGYYGIKLKPDHGSQISARERTMIHLLSKKTECFLL
jgi:energy-coupling factor transporter ATP-binding protein EcfA2